MHKPTLHDVAESATENSLPATHQKVNQRHRSFSSESLFGSAKEIFIEHAGNAYRLRITAQGKLLLTK